MHGRRWLLLAAVGAAALFTLAGCGGGGEEKAGGGGKEKVTLQLKWVTQAQFAGYYAAKAKGYYDAEGLDVTIKPGGPDIVPEQVVIGGQAEFGLDWQDNLLQTRDQGGDIVNIGQVFTRSGMTEVTWKDTGLDSIAKLRGKKVAVWLAGNQHKLFAALTKNGIVPNKDAKIVSQPFDMNLFLNREVDAAAAMTYNELAQVLEQKNPKTGGLYQLSDLNVIKLEDVGVGALEDGIFVRGDWIAQKGNEDVARRFLKASFKGWTYCRDNPAECVDIVLENGPTLGAGHQRWQMNEINALIWPAPRGIGVADPQAFQRTADIVTNFKVVKKRPSLGEAYRTDLAEAAVKELDDEGVDTKGDSWRKATVQITPGGK